MPAFYLPHYLLQLFITYLENDPTRITPSWGWLLAFGLFASNGLTFIVSGVIWSIGLITLRAGIKVQLNTMLFSKTLVKKDIAAVGGDKSVVGGVAEEAEKDKKKKEDSDGKEDDDDDEEAVSSKAQIMVSLFCYFPVAILIELDAFHR